MPVEGKKVTVSELLEIIGLSVFEDIAKALNADKWVMKFPTMTVFKLVVYSMLNSDRISLRVMSEQYATSVFQGLIDYKEPNMAYTSIRSRLINVKAEFFERAFELVSTTLHEHYTEQNVAHYHIKRYDSTMIATFSHLLSGMRVGNTSKKKKQVKFATKLEDDFQIRMTFYQDQAHLSEETTLAELIRKETHSKKDLIVFDRGLKSRKTFVDFDQNEICFFTRLSDSPRFEVQSTHSDVSKIEDERLIYLQDSIVYLYGDGNKLVKHPFRLVQIQRKSDHQIIYLLTNSTRKIAENDENGEPLLLLTTQQVADIYKSRWEIEVLFRFLKQEMNLKHFVSNNTNAIKVMIYCTLIVAMLLLIYKKMNNISSYKIAKIRFASELHDLILLNIIDNPSNLTIFRGLLRKNLNVRE